MSTKRTKRERIKTVWSTRTYDVWGNARDGYEVNDSYSGSDVTLWLDVEHNNVGTVREFASAYPTDQQLRSVFGVRCQIDTDGDDITMYVKRSRDWYPIGELHLESHASLSPIKPLVSGTDDFHVAFNRDTEEIVREIGQHGSVNGSVK